MKGEKSRASHSGAVRRLCHSSNHNYSMNILHHIPNSVNNCQEGSGRNRRRPNGPFKAPQKARGTRTASI
ncbi:MAG: hypothetical protein SOT57_04935, partial [Eubacteriales bacterium]|nr:hypothetical protein [Eubacteriales bacterium]